MSQKLLLILPWKWKLLSCVQLCDSMDCSPSGSSAHGIFQAGILEWVAIPFSRESSWPRNQTQGPNPGLLHCRQILYPLSHQGSPILRLTGWLMKQDFIDIIAHNFWWLQTTLPLAFESCDGTLTLGWWRRTCKILPWNTIHTEMWS